MISNGGGDDDKEDDNYDDLADSADNDKSDDNNEDYHYDDNENHWWKNVHSSCTFTIWNEIRTSDDDAVASAMMIQMKLRRQRIFMRNLMESAIPSLLFKKIVMRNLDGEMSPCAIPSSFQKQIVRRNLDGDISPSAVPSVIILLFRLFEQVTP